MKGAASASEETSGGRSNSLPRSRPTGEQARTVTRGSQLPSFGGGFEWVLKANGSGERELRRQVATDTILACKNGYKLGDKLVSFKCVKEMWEGTRLVAPGSPVGGDVHTSWFKHPPGKAVEVAVHRARANLSVAVVNAASAYSAGGGFMHGGRHALEESMCTQTTLYRSLVAAREIAKSKGVQVSRHAVPPKPRHGVWQCHIPEGEVILSPKVEVFRGGTLEGYPFWDKIVELSAVVSVAMPNCNPDVSDAPQDMPRDFGEYRSLLRKKFTAVCTAAALAGANVLVVPDLGCGVYRNDPQEVGAAFQDVITSFSFDEIHLTGSEEFARAARAS